MDNAAGSGAANAEGSADNEKGGQDAGGDRGLPGRNGEVQQPDVVIRVK